MVINHARHVEKGRFSRPALIFGRTDVGAERKLTQGRDAQNLNLALTSLLQDNLNGTSFEFRLPRDGVCFVVCNSIYRPPRGIAIIPMERSPTIAEHNTITSFCRKSQLSSSGYNFDPVTIYYAKSIGIFWVDGHKRRWIQFI